MCCRKSIETVSDGEKKMMHGYYNKKLRINLDCEKIETDTIPDVLLDRFIGGSGLAAKMLYDHPNADLSAPFSSRNPLIFATGPFTGSTIPCSGRHAVVGQSPLTGIFGESDVGGRFGTAVKKTGHDLIEIVGKARYPVYIFISDTTVRIERADTLWGKDTYRTSELLADIYGRDTKTACIGPAGEKMVPLACIMHDGRHARAAGRCGLGSLMGSKNLKALAVKGGKQLPVADAAGLSVQVRSMVKRIKDSSAYLRQYGTAGGLMCLEASGDLPVKNFSRGGFANGEKLTGELLAETFLSGRFACGACPIGCGREINMTSQKYGVVTGAGPEYETLGALGTYCLVDDLEAVCKGNELCNRYGMDTISVGAAIAFAMEAFENNVINATDCGGISLSWGSGDAMVEMVRQMGEKQGFGAVLGMGVRYAAQVLGHKTAAFALHVKGLELPAHDPRAYVSTGLSYATSNRGACHLAGMTHGVEQNMAVPELGIFAPMDRFTASGKGRMVAMMQDLMGIFDSLKTCKFLLYADITVTDLLTCMNLVTGRQMTMPEFLAAGKRIFNLKRLYNIRCGISSKDDRLPDRVAAQPLRNGGTGGNCPDMDVMRKEYYAFRKWDSNGHPKARLLEELGLEKN